MRAGGVNGERAGGVHGDGGGVGNKGEVLTARCHSANREGRRCPRRWRRCRQQGRGVDGEVS